MLNSFQILDKDGKPVGMETLDKQACVIWGKEFSKKGYAFPGEGRFAYSGNWFDTLGWIIANQGNACGGWTNIIASMIAESIGMHLIDTDENYKERPVAVAEFEKKENGKLHLPDAVEEKIYGTLSYAKQYIPLIHHWQSLGYTPKKIVSDSNKLLGQRLQEKPGDVYYRVVQSINSQLDSVFWGVEFPFVFEDSVGCDGKYITSIIKEDDDIKLVTKDHGVIGYKHLGTQWKAVLIERIKKAKSTVVD